MRTEVARAADGLARLAAFQAAYFLATGLWPLLHMPSFLAVTGPKTDLWLVQTVGVLVAAIGTSLLVAAIRRQVAGPTAALAAASAAGLATIDLIFVALGTIRPIYLADAALEVALLLAWGVLLGRARSEPSSRSADRSRARRPA